MTDDTKTVDREHALLLTTEVAAVLRCSRRSVENLIRAGELPAVRHLGRWRVRRDQLDAYVDSLETNQAAS